MTPELTGVLILITLLFILMFIKVPIAFALGISSVITAIYLDISLLLLFQKMVSGINSFTFLAVPFFILAADIMNHGGISDKLMSFARVLVGRVRGGTAFVNVLASMFFGGISGSSVADVSSIGAMLIPIMEKEGYDKDFSVALTVTTSVQGVLIPPSQNMIYYALAAGGLSISNLFLAGYIPGILLGIGLMVPTYLISVKRKYPKGGKVSLKEGISVAIDALTGLFMVFIIIGGVVFGIFTATESAAVATVYAILITFFLYKQLNFKVFKTILVSSTKTLATVLAIIATSSAFGFMLSYLKVPTMITEFFLGVSDNAIVIILIINLLLLIAGMFMDMGVLILILTPILLPVVTNIGMDPLHFGIIMIMNLGIGLCTPPVGTSLMVGCAIADLPIEKSIKALLPFYGAMVAILLLVTLVPQVTLWLPTVFGS